MLIEWYRSFYSVWYFFYFVSFCTLISYGLRLIEIEVILRLTDGQYVLVSSTLVGHATIITFCWSVTD
jgi:hypothetical protein